MEIKFIKDAEIPTKLQLEVTENNKKFNVEYSYLGDSCHCGYRFMFRSLDNENMNNDATISICVKTVMTLIDKLLDTINKDCSFKTVKDDEFTMRVSDCCIEFECECAVIDIHGFEEEL